MCVEYQFCIMLCQMLCGFFVEVVVCVGNNDDFVVDVVGYDVFFFSCVQVMLCVVKIYF